MGDGSTITIGLAISLVASLLSLLWYFSKEIEQERRWREEADDELRALIDRNALNDQNGRSLVQRELQEHRLDSLERFASTGRIDKLEERLSTALEKIDARQETIIGRMEKMNADIARAIPRSVVRSS